MNGSNGLLENTSKLPLDLRVLRIDQVPAGPSRYIGAVAGAAPANGSWQLGDWAPDTTNGGTWTCTTAGSPGTWQYSTHAINAYNYPYLHKALANILAAQSGDFKLGIIGDSTTWGFGSGIGGTGNMGFMASLLSSAGYPAAIGMSIPVLPSIGGGDARWSVGTGWSQTAGTFGFGASNATYNGASGAAANTLTFTPSGGYSYDSFDVYYCIRSGAGTFHVNIDGGADTVINAAGSTAVGMTTVSGSAATNHVLQLGTVTVGQVIILGVEPWLSTTPKIRVANLGVYGTRTTDWINTAQGNNGSIACVEKYAATNWIINLGINDANQHTSTATYFANMATLIAACKNTASDVIVTSVYPSNVTTSGALYGESLQAQQLPAFCAAQGVRFVDIFGAWGGVNGWTPLDNEGYYYDNFHPSRVGYADAARILVNGLLGA